MRSRFPLALNQEEFVDFPSNLLLLICHQLLAQLNPLFKVLDLRGTVVSHYCYNLLPKRDSPFSVMHQSGSNHSFFLLAFVLSCFIHRLKNG